jgi:hypothetical protein
MPSLVDGSSSSGASGASSNGNGAPSHSSNSSGPSHASADGNGAIAASASSSSSASGSRSGSSSPSGGRSGASSPGGTRAGGGERPKYPPFDPHVHGVLYKLRAEDLEVLAKKEAGYVLREFEVRGGSLGAGAVWDRGGRAGRSSRRHQAPSVADMPVLPGLVPLPRRQPARSRRTTAAA